ncbi:phenylalanine--tRNA ligase subunit alpha [Enterobacteriaceae endosymbiont of Donacia versicolorea]|uniref:phenylalanine--tRNA ligase subunit alpha n=1 Tax=Enterobacteriaceae endosymbiont of Donacia versicolorea TaxID=2675788 RepID=UPI001448AFDB|nr:phenylalanine--tRNA ligase subunit alpha [Enterobacteriaceae endosymbiont of Donacia versicolorea]QJC31981.1 phenylalanine--tRNA ligase subunit alpha [Enterobacteriaceae endosymbiont of Donacia versicolorea]
MKFDDDLIINAKKEICETKDIINLNKLKIKYLGKKGYISSQFLLIKKLNKKEKISKSIIINYQKKIIKEIIQKRKKEIEFKINSKQYLSQEIDISLPGKSIKMGSEHPLSYIIKKIENFFIKIGFQIVIGLEIEDSFHNFDALNIPKNHPARTKKDTFWLDKNILLRTQTSNVQIRIMKEKKLPIRILTAGKVYRNDCDSNHTPMFHQIEGLYINNNVNFVDLKGILSLFLNFFFGKKCKIRFRPSYFPFTEPSLEIDVLNKNKKWIEVLGAGMVHPNVLKNVNINSSKYCGYAFGIGVERLTMLYYNISDIRLFYKNDLRFLKQFKLNNFI